MPIHRLFVESVDLGRFSLSACGPDLFRDCVNLTQVAASQKYSRTFPCKRSGNGSPDRPTSSVDYRVFVRQHCFPFSRYIREITQDALPGTKPANSRSSALAAPVRQPSAMDRDTGSGKISSSSFSNPSKMPRAAVSTEALGISKPRFISVSMGPRKTAWTVTPWPAKTALNDCVILNAAAFEME